MQNGLIGQYISAATPTSVGLAGILSPFAEEMPPNVAGFLTPEGDDYDGLTGNTAELFANATQIPLKAISSRHGLFTEDIAQAHINCPTTFMSPEIRLWLYRFIPETLRTSHTKNLMRIGEIMQYFKELTPEDCQRDPKKLMSMANEMSDLYEIVRDIYTEEDSLPIFGVTHMLNSAYARKNPTVIRFDFDIGILNSKSMDQTGSLADEYIPAIGHWFKRNIVDNRPLLEKFGLTAVTAVRLPERTSFLLIGGEDSQKDAFIQMVTEKMAGFKEDMQREMKHLQEIGMISPAADLSRFEASGVVYARTIQLKKFMDEYAAGQKRKNIRRVPRRVVVKHIIEELKAVAAETILFKSQRSPHDGSLMVGAFSMYNETMLPPPDDRMHESLKLYLDTERGFVPFGQFGHQDVQDREIRDKLEFQDVPQDLGEISRTRHLNGGGYREHFRFWAKALSNMPDLAVDPIMIENLKKEAKAFATAVLHMGEVARRDFRYPALMKSTRSWKGESSDFFVEQIPMMEKLMNVKYDGLMTVEIDDATSFVREHPSKDHIDAKFTMIKKLLYMTADELGLPPIIVAAEGDQIRVAFSTKAVDGKTVLMETFARAYQALVREYYSGDKFQPVTKVGLTKLPLWRKKRDHSVIVPAAEPPGPDYLPHLKTMTVTITYTKMPDVYSPGAKERINHKVRAMYDYIANHLKTQKGLYKKEGIGELPASPPL